MPRHGPRPTTAPAAAAPAQVSARRPPTWPQARSSRASRVFCEYSSPSMHWATPASRTLSTLPTTRRTSSTTSFSGGSSRPRSSPCSSRGSRRGPKDEAVESISAVLTLAGVVLLAATLVFFFAAPFIIDLYTVGSHGSEIATERQVATALLRLFSPQLLAYGAISLMTAVLNTARRFSAPAFTPILNNVVAIGVLLAFAAVGHTHNLARSSTTVASCCSWASVRRSAWWSRLWPSSPACCPAACGYACAGGRATRPCARSSGSRVGRSVSSSATRSPSSSSRRSP